MSGPSIDMPEDTRGSIEYMFEFSHGMVDRHVLPYSNHLPAGIDKSLICEIVALDSPEELWIPVRAVNCRAPAVVGTRMPETPVNKDGNASPSENDVWTNRPFGKIYPKVFSESIAIPVESRSHCKLRRGVRSLDGLHIPHPTRRGWRFPRFLRHVFSPGGYRQIGAKMPIDQDFTFRTCLGRNA